ncbi:MAG: pyruvoyl-dependent arginine decarboxylase [Armatimonadota bacterium]
MPSQFVPRKFFLTRGVGVHQDRLVSFEMALRDAQVPQFNLVTVSSILPPNCVQVEPEEGLRHLSPGEIVFCVLSRNESNDPGRTIAASVGMAVPENRNRHGYIAEHHDSGMTEQQACWYTERQSVAMLSTAVGEPFSLKVAAEPLDPSELPDMVRGTLSIAQEATIDAEGNWTTVVAAAVFVLPEA